LIRGGKISYIFQEPATSLNPVFTIGDQIKEVLMLHRELSSEDQEKEASFLLSRVGIQDAPARLHAYPHELSGGMKQRVMIAMALASHPKLLIADEPTTALDVTIQDEILSLLLQLKKETGIGLLFITHDLSLVSQVADTLAIMYCGKIVEKGKAEEVLKAPRHPYTLGLIECVPKPGLRKKALSVIPGSLPDPTMLPSGCHFHPRCLYKVPDCEQNYPQAKTKADHTVSCYQAEEVVKSFKDRLQ